jgi:hypothetical protein
MVYGSLLAGEDVMAPEAQKAVDSQATQLRAVGHSRELRATALRRRACRPG